MDFVGPINPPSKKKQYIIMRTDYLTKWVETKAIKATTEEKVAQFLRDNIFYIVGYPRELVIDQGSEFTSNLIEDLLTHNRIKHRTSTPYHRQANGMQALLHTEVVQVQRKIWHDKNIKEIKFQEGDMALLYDSRYKDFKGMLRTSWLGPYIVEKCNDNGSILIKTIDDEAIPMFVNEHQLKVYKKPISK
eukprot:PITA_03467